MIQRPYHHGDLRSALLSRAEETLREAGVDGLSLRELARDVGVSHGAPRRHFRDRGALLDSLAVEGFGRLSAALEEAAFPVPGRSFEGTLAAVAVAYVTFATDNPALLELMFTTKHQAEASLELRDAANASFSTMAALVEEGQASGELVAGDLERIGLVLFAMLQGIPSLANTKMIDSRQLDQLTGYAVQALLNGLAPRSEDSAAAPPAGAG